MVTGSLVSTYSPVETLAVIAGDADNDSGWQCLFEQEHARCFGIAYSILQSHDLADDAVQNALLYLRDHAGAEKSPA